MPFCPSCGRKVQIEAAFCPYCGRNLKETLKPKLSEEKPLGKIVTSTPSKKSHLLRNIIIAAIVIVVAAGGIAGYLSTKGDLFPTQHRINIVSGSTVIHEMWFSDIHRYSYEAYVFNVPTGATNIHVIGNFTAYGGSGDDIRVSVVDGYRSKDTDEWWYTNSYYYSETVHTARFDVKLPAGGVYHIVLDNRFSVFSPKQVYIQADLVYTGKGVLALG